MIENIGFYHGVDVRLERDKAEEIDAQAFERKMGVKPTDHYQISSRFDPSLENYIYLGNGWSICFGAQGMSYYILPSHNPHYYTRPSSEIDPELVAWAIDYIYQNIIPVDEFEMEA